MNDSLPSLVPVTPDNVAAACKLQLRPGQEKFVAPVVFSLAEAYASNDIAWPRLAMVGDRVAGFVMGAFDPTNEVDFFRCGIWRLNVAADFQRRGIGRFLCRAVAAEADHRGERRLTVLWVPGEGGPEAFYRAIGFTPTGQEFHDQIVGEISTDDLLAV